MQCTATKQILNNSHTKRISIRFRFNEIVTEQSGRTRWIEKENKSGAKRERRRMERTRKPLSGSLVISFYPLFHTRVRWLRSFGAKNIVNNKSVDVWRFVLCRFLLLSAPNEKKTRNTLETITENLDKRTEHFMSEFIGKINGNRIRHTTTSTNWPKQDETRYVDSVLNHHHLQWLRREKTHRKAKWRQEALWLCNCWL